MTIMNNCMESAFSAAVLATNGPSPRVAPQMASKATVRRQALVPPGPKRTAAHSSSGSGA